MARTARAPVVPDSEPPGLSEQQREIYRLAREGAAVEEIARKTGTTPGNIRGQLHKIRSKNNDTKSGTPGPPGLTAALEGLSEFDTAHLTGRQQEVIGFLRDGQRTRDIARHYGITTRAARALRARARLRLADERPEVRTYQMDGTLKVKLAERYGDRDPFRIEDPEEEARKREFGRSTVRWVYKAVVGGSPGECDDEPPLPRREALKALGREGHGGGEARRAIAGARAKGLKVIAVGSRHELLRAESPEDRRLLRDILAEYFRELDTGVYLEAVGGAKSILTEEYTRRRRG